ncbi:MAG: PQQ-dependent sugar dehydrogenase [Cytophagales bacterium]|nr:PQQ-dependent sugar dehydrogenase [Cytophagales bacterium]
MKNKSKLWSIITGILLMSSSYIHGQSLPSGFVVQQLGTLSNPVSITFIPDGRILLARQDGYLYLFTNGAIQSPHILQLDSIYWGNEKGFLGIAVDPDFTTNGYIYCYYTINVTNNTYQGIVLNRNNTIMHKIARYTMSGNSIVSGSKRTILDMDITNGNFINVNHDGGQMHFGPDGKLYLVTGEGDLWCPCYTPNGASCDWSCNACVGRTQPNCVSYQWADNWNCYFGKLLRINKDGSAPTDNPYYTTPTPVYGPQKYIYARGFRNPFTMHFKPGTSDIYINDIGSSNQSAREEINKVTPTSGKHFGWPSVEGNSGNSAYVNPIYYYGHCANLPSCTVKSGTTAGCAITGGVFYSTVSGVNAWPSQYHGKYFYMDFCNGWINTVDFDNSNNVVNFAQGLASNVGNTSTGIGALFLEVGTDNQMYYMTRSLSAGLNGLYRISYQPVTVSSLNFTVTSGAGGCSSIITDIQPSNATIKDITWVVSPSSLAGVVNNQLVAYGNGVVTVTAISNSSFNIKSTQVLNLSLSTSTITLTGAGSISSDKGNLQLGVSSSNSCITPGQLTWTYATSDPTATVSITSNGLVIATGLNGTITVTGTLTANNSVKSIKIISISGQTAMPQSLSINSASNTITVLNGITTLTSVILPSIAVQDVIWQVLQGSSLVSLQTLSGNMLAVSAIQVGTDTLKVKATSVINSTITSTIAIPYNVSTLSGIASKVQDLEILRLIPNPNDGNFEIEYMPVAGQDITVYVMNQSGADLYSKIIKNFAGSAKVNISHLPKGIYRVTLATATGSYHKLMVME